MGKPTRGKDGIRSIRSIRVLGLGLGLGLGLRIGFGFLLFLNPSVIQFSPPGETNLLYISHSWLRRRRLAVLPLVPLLLLLLVMLLLLVTC